MTETYNIFVTFIDKHKKPNTLKDMILFSLFYRLLPIYMENVRQLTVGHPLQRQKPPEYLRLLSKPSKCVYVYQFVKLTFLILTYWQMLYLTL